MWHIKFDMSVMLSELLSKWYSIGVQAAGIVAVGLVIALLADKKHRSN